MSYIDEIRAEERIYTEAEVIEILTKRANARDKQFGSKFYGNQIRETIEAFKQGEVVMVESEDWVEHSMDFTKSFYSDGTSSISCYGYYD